MTVATRDHKPTPLCRGGSRGPSVGRGAQHDRLPAFLQQATAPSVSCRSCSPNISGTPGRESQSADGTLQVQGRRPGAPHGLQGVPRADASIGILPSHTHTQQPQRVDVAWRPLYGIGAQQELLGWALRKDDTHVPGRTHESIYLCVPCVQWKVRVRGCLKNGDRSGWSRRWCQDASWPLFHALLTPPPSRFGVLS